MEAGYTVFYGPNLGSKNTICFNLNWLNEVIFQNRNCIFPEYRLSEQSIVAIFRIKKYHNKPETDQDAQN